MTEFALINSKIAHLCPTLITDIINIQKRISVLPLIFT